MQNNQWKITGDQLLTKSPIELEDNSYWSRSDSLGWVRRVGSSMELENLQSGWFRAHAVAPSCGTPNSCMILSIFSQLASCSFCPRDPHCLPRNPALRISVQIVEALISSATNYRGYLRKYRHQIWILSWELMSCSKLNEVTKKLGSVKVTPYPDFEGAF